MMERFSILIGELVMQVYASVETHCSLNIPCTPEIIVELQKDVKIVQRGYMYSLPGFFHWFNLT